MIQPEDIRRKAENLYPRFLREWVEGNVAFFPRTIPGNRKPDANDLPAAIEAVQRLHDGAKEKRGFGYTVHWREVNSKKLGRNQFPQRIVFETQGDFLRFIGKQDEFAALAEAVERLRSVFPELQDWIRSNIGTLTEHTGRLEGLIHVARYFRENPRPNRFARELPLSVDTKFIDRHQGVLRQWLDILLPPQTIRADERHFERRYGLRYAQPHLMVRFLDEQLQQELGFPCPELSLPLETLGGLPVRDAAIYIVENKVNLLTLPPQRRGIGLGGLGKSVTALRYIGWLAQNRITYWGDLDVDGFGILSSLRALFPHTGSLLMDKETLRRWEPLAGEGTGAKPDVPPHLTDFEKAAFNRCREENLRLEQEQIPQSAVLGAV